MIYKLSLFSFAQEQTLRDDIAFQKYNKQIEENYYFLKELFSIENNKVDYNQLVNDFKYCEIGNVSKDGEVSPVTLNFDNRLYENENYFTKIEKGDIISVKENYILLSKVRPNLKKFVRVTKEFSDIYFTSAFIPLKPRVLSKIMYYCFRTIFYESLMSISRQGKGYPTLKETDLLYLKFNKSIIDKLVLKETEINRVIDRVENEISILNRTITPTQIIIDKVFQKEFNFDYDKFEELKKISRFDTAIKDFSNNPDLRFSAKFHRSAGEFVKQELAKITDKKIKHFLAEPIVLGASVSPSDYDENGGYHYLSMATIKDWDYNNEEAQLVSDIYALSKADKTIRNNDIILARSGEGTIGKVALIEDEEAKAVFADFTMRIRLKNYNQKFAYYYMRSMYFQYLIEIYKKGLGNNTNIFPIVIREFPLPDISLTEQERIVNEIQSEIDNQTEIKNKIADLRNKIDEIIEKTIQE